MVWPGCTLEGNPPKQAGCPLFTYRIQSLVCPEPFALPRCWQKAVAETHVRISVCMWMIRCWSLWRCPGLVQFTSITVISGLEILGFYSSPVHDQWYPEAALLCCALPGWAVPCSCWLAAVLRPWCDNWHYIEWHWTKIPKGDQERWSGEQLAAWVVSLGLGWQPSSQGTLSDKGGTCHPLGLPAKPSLSP